MTNDANDMGRATSSTFFRSCEPWKRSEDLVHRSLRFQAHHQMIYDVDYQMILTCCHHKNVDILR